jgi:hypothetical protein
VAEVQGVRDWKTLSAQGTLPWLTMRWQIFINCALSANRTLVGSTLPLT